jgi:predicted transposase YbfD/YdcC
VKARALEQRRKEASKLVEHQEQKSDNLIHTALDGKVMRGTQKQGRDDQPRVHLLSFYECESGIVLDQFPVSSKNNEESACIAILHPVLVKGRIITADSLFASRKWCATVDAFDGYYLIPIKENNPAVLLDLLEFFGDEEILEKECEYHKEVNKGHGRLEVREIWASTEMNEFFQKDWANIAQVFIIRRTITDKDGVRIQILCGLTNLPRKKANAQRLLELNRKHWHIENRLHYRRDVTLGEDDSQVRTMHAPAVLAALNGGILAFMDFLGVKNVAKQMRHYCAHPEDSAQLLLSKLWREDG